VRRIVSSHGVWRAGPFLSRARSTIPYRSDHAEARRVQLQRGLVWAAALVGGWSSGGGTADGRKEEGEGRNPRWVAVTYETGLVYWRRNIGSQNSAECRGEGRRIRTSGSEAGAGAGRPPRTTMTGPSGGGPIPPVRVRSAFVVFMCSLSSFHGATTVHVNTAKRRKRPPGRTSDADPTACPVSAGPSIPVQAHRQQQSCDLTSAIPIV
jgi:hypothetical protein